MKKIMKYYISLTLRDIFHFALLMKNPQGEREKASSPFALRVLSRSPELDEGRDEERLEWVTEHSNMRHLSIIRNLIICSIFLSTHVWCKYERVELRDTRFTSAFTAGYVFKYDDCWFKEIYGTGMVNAITADFCYTPWEYVGFGTKVSYFRAKGETNFHKRCTFLYEVPFTFYASGMWHLRCNLRLYGSLGGGVVWIKEKSYLGTVHATKGIGEAEIGAVYPVWSHLIITGAFRVLFPRQSLCDGGPKVNIGGCDLRAGIGFAF